MIISFRGGAIGTIRAKTRRLNGCSFVGYALIPMFPRPLLTSDLSAINEIDATAQSSHYLHMNREVDELTTVWRIEARPLREPVIRPNRMNDDLAFTARQVIGGIEDGAALGIEIDGVLAAALIAQARPEANALMLHDVRVDYDFRRQGLGTALACALIGIARDTGVRGILAETRTDNYPASLFLRKLGFESAGLDTHRFTNHDLVKERATLLWCAALD